MIRLTTLGLALTVALGALTTGRAEAQRPIPVSIESDPPGLGFEAAAIDAVTGWRFKPARKDYRRVHSYTVLDVYTGDPVPRGKKSMAFSISCGESTITTLIPMLRMAWS